MTDTPGVSRSSGGAEQRERSGAERRPEPVLARGVEDAQLRDVGYVVLAGALPPSAIESLTRLFESTMVGDVLAEGFTTSMLLSDPVTRATIWDGIVATVSPIVGPQLAGERSVVGGLFVVKPPSADSARDPHQDAPGFDERGGVVVSLWIPLVDVTPVNGAVHFLESSHRMGNDVRPRDVDSLSAELKELALERARPVEMRAGQILALDAAVVHHSPANRSAALRPAVICTLATARATPMFALSADGAPEGMAELYDVDLEVFRSGDVMSPVLDRSRRRGRASYQQATTLDYVTSCGADRG